MAMKWLKHLLHLSEPVRRHGQPDRVPSVAMMVNNEVRLPGGNSSRPGGISPPLDWSDIAGWNLYLKAKSIEGPFGVPTAIGARGWELVRFLKFAKDQGGKVWFPGCGTDPGPRFYAYVGCTVMATDFSPVAVHVQQYFAGLAPQIMFADWSSFVEGNPLFEKSGRFDVAEHDFVVCPPPGVFDVVINCRAFQGLPPSAMRAVAKHFFAALRPGGAAIIDTINVHGTACDPLEDSLMDAGFFLPFSTSERWYRNQLENTGIAYGMVLGRPQLRYDRRHPREHFKEYEERDRKILASFRTEYETRHAAEESFVNETMRQPETIVAHVVYNTG